jgi:hypothetical protein
MEISHPTFYRFLEELKCFLRSEEDRRREKKRLRDTHAALVAAGQVLITQPSKWDVRSGALKIVCLRFQDLYYQTNPVSTGLVLFLSEIAAILNNDN